jgi:hypothetical protein
VRVAAIADQRVARWTWYWSLDVTRLKPFVFEFAGAFSVVGSSHDLRRVALASLPSAGGGRAP